MSSYIGLPGALVPIRSAASETATKDRPLTELRPFSGARLVQLGRRVTRSWAIEYNNRHPRDYAMLDAMTRWDSPLSWVGATAQHTNLLTPEQADMDPSALSLSGGASVLRGALDLGGGLWVPQWAGGGAISTVGLTSAKSLPVLPGVPLTVSAYVQRADPATPVQAVFDFFNAAGGTVSAVTRSSPAGAGIVRGVWGLTPPAGAASLALRFRYAAVLAAPQVTWTSTATGWAPGRGVHRVVVRPGNESTLTAHARQVLTSAAFTILEVG